jgi:hypothetical protein
MLRWLVIPTALFAALLAGCAEEEVYTCEDEIEATVSVTETSGRIEVDTTAPDANAVIEIDAVIQVSCNRPEDHLNIIASGIYEDLYSGVKLADLNVNFPGGSLSTPVCEGGVGTYDRVDLIDNGTPNSALMPHCRPNVALWTTIGRVGCTEAQASRVSKTTTGIQCSP